MGKIGEERTKNVIVRQESRGGGLCCGERQIGRRRGKGILQYRGVGKDEKTAVVGMGGEEYQQNIKSDCRL